MFFFDFNNSTSATNAITQSLVSDSFVHTAELDSIRTLLGKETEKQGLRSSDLAELTGWSPSKTSKLTAGRQRLTAEDIRTWSRALGYTPDPFIDGKADIRYYNLGGYIRKPSDALEAYFCVLDGEPEHAAIAQYELPLSILAMLGVKISDYAVRANASGFTIDPVTRRGFGNTATYIRFWQRTTADNESMTPEFGLWLSPENDYFLFAVYLNRKSDDGAMPQLRAAYKDTLQVEDKYTDEFDKFAEMHRDWIPGFLRQGEIVSIGSDTNMLPQPGDFENTLIDLFRKYCALVWEVKGIDLLPEKYKQREEISSFRQLDILNGYADFYPEVKEKILQREKYLCENDPAHSTFVDALGRQYMEVVPIVPFEEGMQFGTNIFEQENGVCLCPMCRAQMKYGSLNDREDMIFKLFRKHQKALQEKGIDISLTQVLAANGLA